MSDKKTTDNESLSDILYESIFDAGRKRGISLAVIHDVAIMADHSLRQKLGVSRVYVAAAENRERDQQIIQARQQGESFRNIARRVSCSPQTACNVCRCNGVS